MDEQWQETTGLALDFLSGGGEMGRHLRGHEWETTPLGRPERWPVALKSAVKLLLAARSPIAVGWGPDLLTLHNEAYASVMRAPSPDRVGLPFRELSPEVWQQVEPLVANTMARGESAVLENQLFCIYRGGYAEETYLSFCCDPIVDHAANVPGVIFTVTETTEQVISARRTAALREVAAAGAAARSVEDAARHALDAISRHPIDIPFALLYATRDAPRGQARLVATSKLAAGTSASPHLLALNRSLEESSWPIASALGTNSPVVVDDLPARFDPLPAGDWPLAPRRAVMVPLTTPGREQPDAVLVAGVSARHELDASYLDFISLVAKHVVAVMTGGRLREEEERDAVTRAAAKLAHARRRARMRAMKARFTGALEERTRLAREIHDTLLQGVTGIALQLRAALPHLQTSPDEAFATLERIAALAEKTSHEARQVVWDIRPNALDKQAFVRAVESAAHQTIGAAPLKLRVNASGRARRLESDAQGVVLRIVQEAVANAVRHAAASTIRLTSAFGERHLRVAIADDGRGFAVEPDFRSYAGHWGLVGMRERAERLGASLHVQSTPRCGTTVSLVLPLPAAGPDTPARRGSTRSLNRQSAPRVPANQSSM